MIKTMNFLLVWTLSSMFNTNAVGHDRYKRDDDVRTHAVSLANLALSRRACTDAHDPVSMEWLASINREREREKKDTNERLERLRLWCNSKSLNWRQASGTRQKTKKKTKMTNAHSHQTAHESNNDSLKPKYEWPRYKPMALASMSIHLFVSTLSASHSRLWRFQRSISH